MTYYVTVKETANLLGVKEETVRRWCRTGKLKGTMDSRRKGIRIELNDIFRFVNDTPRYDTMLVRIKLIVFAHMICTVELYGRDRFRSKVEEMRLRKNATG